MGKKLSEMSLPSVDKGKHGFAGREAPLTVLSSLLYGSKAASSALSGTLPASEKLLRTPALQKGRDGKAAGRRHAGAFRARERSQHVPFEVLGRVCPCQSRVEELWHLFPILLTEHQACWNNWYAEEAANLKQILPQAEKIYHIGSTAIPSIWAKPIIDILAEVPRECDLPKIKALLTNSGYICMSQSPDRVSLNKGYTENGFAQRVFHLHLRCAGDHDELYFRDYLLENPEAAKEYEALKLKLWDEYRYNRDGYTEAKADFVAACTLKAKQLYRNRYEMAAQPPTSS